MDFYLCIEKGRMIVLYYKKVIFFLRLFFFYQQLTKSSSLLEVSMLRSLTNRVDTENLFNIYFE